MDEIRTDRRTAARFGGILALLSLLAVGVEAQAPEVKPSAVKATGLFPVKIESSLILKGLTGQVVVTARSAREVRFVSKAKDKSGSERPLAVFLDGTKMTIAPPPGTTLPEGIVRLDVPASFSVRIESSGGTALVDGVAGGVEFVTTGTEARAQALTGSLDATVGGGTLRLSNVATASVRASGAVVAIDGASGDVVARLVARSSFTATNLRGALDLDSEDSLFKVQGLAGGIRVRAVRGSGELTGLGSGGDLQLTATPLRMNEGQGDITITSDAAVEFAKMEASMHFDLYGGSLKGKGNEGLLEVRTRNAEVQLEAIAGGARIQGDGLKAKLVDMRGDLYVETMLSDVSIERTLGPVELDLERGNVVLNGAQGPIDATVRAGDVQFSGLSGPVQLDLDGGNAEISWAAIAGGEDTLLQNASGDISVRFPAGASCRVEAKTKTGRITSDVSTIKVQEDGMEAQGQIGPGDRPIIKIDANGSIKLSEAPKAPPKPS